MNTRALIVPLILFLYSFSLIMPLNAQAPDSEAKTRTLLINDLKDPAMDYRNFRTTQSAFRECPEKLPSREGLDALRMSGSSAFSRKGLLDIKKRIPSASFTIVDLRQESHGLIDDRPVSWKNEHNSANIGLSRQEIEKDEAQKLKEAKEKDPSLRTACTEEALCREMGIGYIRLPVTDYSGPDDATVDRFISLISTLPRDRWLHFHCKAGVGRATTFMVLYDMMRNAGTVSYDDIIMRQFLIGGINLSGIETDSNAWFAPLSLQRDTFIKVFYRYCSEKKGDYREKWSAWKARRS